jgi:SAM-dependent methyltransferase
MAALSAAGAPYMNVEEYRKLAEVEDRMWYFRALHAHIERELVAALGSRPAAVLDAGCGTGGLIHRLGPLHPQWNWSALDASEVACGLARQRLDGMRTGETQVEVQLGSVAALPYDNATFDAIVSADVLYHVDDDAGALKEFFRVLRPGGVVVLNVPAYRWLWSYHDVAVHSRRRYGRRELLGKAANAGFGGLRATYWNTLPFPLIVARRKLLPPPRDGSDVHLFPVPIEAAFDVAMAFERRWIRTLGRLPFGSSVFAVGRK